MELEQKYLVRNEETMNLVKQLLLSLFPSAKEISKIQHDTYFDTRDHSLLHRGASLRIRWKGIRSYILTIKTGGERTDGRFCREEQEFSIRLPEPELCREAIMTTFCDLPANTTFRPMAKVENQRTVILLDGKVEAAFDQVSYPQSATPAAEELQLELEVIGEGGEALLDKLTRALKAVDGLTPMTESKYQRAMALK